MGRAPGVATHARLACGCSPRLWAAAGPSPWPRALCSSLASPVLTLAGLGRGLPIPKTHREGRVVQPERWQRGELQRGEIPALLSPCSGLFGHRGVSLSPLSLSVSPRHPRRRDGAGRVLRSAG